MGMPKSLKAFSLFVNGINYVGECTELQLPKLSRKVETYRAGGFLGDVSIDLGIDKLEVTHTYGGMVYAILAEFGLPSIDGSLMRFAGAYQRDDTGGVDAVEIIMRGRHNDFDFGKSASGEKTEVKIKSDLTYYGLVVNAVPLITIDLINMIEIIGGVDRQLAIRRAIGRSTGLIL